jgi:hypothetical protein
MRMGKKDEKVRLGKQPPRYRFFFNPYRDARFSKCPQCSNKMGQRKLPLFIHINPKQPLLLNKTCRYCSHCDLVIAHRNEVERLIPIALPWLDPETVRDQYLVIGTVDRADWKRISQNNLPVQATIEALHDFKEVVIFKPVGGWEFKEVSW